MKRSFLTLFVCLALLPAAFGQYYVFSTIAGNGQFQFTGANQQATTVSLVQPGRIAADSVGNFYFCETYFHQVFRVAPDGVITLVAGSGVRGFSGDNGPATQAQLDSPAGLAVGADGSVYISDTGNSRIRRVSGGTITTLYGNGRFTVEGDGGQASAAAIGNPGALLFDGSGSLYISQSNHHVIRKIAPGGIITTVAGNGTNGFAGDGGLATAARLSAPAGIALDSAGSLFIADMQNNRVRRVGTDGNITTVAGNGSPGATGDGAAATEASFGTPIDVAVDGATLYIAANSNGHIRAVTAGNISRFGGGGSQLNDGPANQAALSGVGSMINDGKGNLVIQDGRRIRRIALATRAVTTAAGILPGLAPGDNQAATSAYLLSPSGVAINPSGEVFIADGIDHRVRKVSSTGVITTVAGNGINGGTDAATAVLSQVGQPRALAFDPSGNLLIVSTFGGRLRRVTPEGNISTIAGGLAGFAGDGGPAASALFFGPTGAVADANGNIFVSDTNNHRIRRIDAVTGFISTIAGDGTPDFGGDGGPAAQAKLSSPRHMAFDRNGGLLIADTGNRRIRRIADGTIVTIAGNGETGTGADGVLATAAPLGFPISMAVDSANNIYLAQFSLVQKIDAATGKIHRIAGSSNGTLGFAGDGGLATDGLIAGPGQIAINAAGELLLADLGNQRIRKLTPAQIVREGVVNGGTLRASPAAPGAIMSIFGFNLGPAAGAGLRLDSSGKVATEVAGTQVFFDNVPAPILYTSAGQVNVVAPYSVSGSSTQVRVVFNGATTNTITVPVAPTSPGFFAITNQNGTVNAASNRAARNSVLVFYGTGEGQTNPGGVDGAVSNSVFPAPLAPITVTIGGQNATIHYAGAAPGFVSGVLQMNVQVPAGVTGNAALVVKMGDATLSGTTIFVQ